MGARPLRGLENIKRAVRARGPRTTRYDVRSESVAHLVTDRERAAIDAARPAALRPATDDLLQLDGLQRLELGRGLVLLHCFVRRLVHPGLLVGVVIGRITSGGPTPNACEISWFGDLR